MIFGFQGIYLWFFVINSIIAIIVIILERRRPEKTIAWLLIFTVFPPIGMFFYIFIGRNWKKHKLNEEFSPYVKGLVYRVINRIKDPDYLPLVELLAKNSDSPLFVDNDIKIFTDGKEMFNVLIDKMEKAKDHIHLEYYIVKSDNIGNKIKEVLVRKAKQGVKVKFIMDRVGSIKVKKSYIKELKEAGVDVVQYSYVLAPVLRFINTSINYRNHRKIVVIDGKVGFIGGMNIGDEYLGNGRLGMWRDAHIMVQGDFVLGLQGVFLDDFMAIKRVKDPNFSYDESFEEYFHEVPKSKGKIMQLVMSGPDSLYPSIMHGILKMISMAKDHIYITSPYFIPPECIMEELKVAALSGVDVTILFPGEYDHLPVYYASRSYIAELLKCGVKVYIYKKNAFVHSKIVTVDSKISTIGTANMDIRSYELNYEVNAVVYDEEITKQFEELFKKDISEAALLTQEVYDKTSLWIKFVEAFMRIFSSLM